MKTNSDFRLKTAGFRKNLVITFLLLGLFVGISFISESHGSGSICLIYNTTGVPCPTCGMTRSYLALFQGNLRQALVYHPLFFLVPVLFYAFYYQKKQLLYSLFVIFILVYVGRMILFFPHTEPMLYDRFSIWGRLLTLIGRLLK